MLDDAGLAALPVTGVFEIHIFVGPLNPTDAQLADFQRVCALGGPPLEGLRSGAPADRPNIKVGKLRVFISLFLVSLFFSFLFKVSCFGEKFHP